MKEHFDHQKAETQREQMRNEIDRMKRLLENNDTVVHKQVNQNYKLFSAVRSLHFSADIFLSHVFCLESRCRCSRVAWAPVKQLLACVKYAEWTKAVRGCNGGEIL